jgi:hypothetical protein
MTDTIERVNDDSGEIAVEGASERRRRLPRLEGWRRSTLVIAGLVSLAGGIPLLVALGVLHSPRWYPLLDMAQTELRVRDVGSRNPPLVGLAGRIRVEINGQDVAGSHPGPLSFYALWPTYILFGATAWALQVATAVLNLLAMTAATWIAHRRGGWRLALGIAAGLAVLGRAYSPAWLTEGWNPYMPMLWWVVFLLAIWSLLCHDLMLLPVAVFAGSLCMQTHVPYMGLVAGVGVVALVAIVMWFIPRRNESKPRRYLFSWGAPSLALGGLLWLPPIYEQFTRPRGNFWMIYESFADPSEARPGFRTDLKVWLANLDPAHLVRGHSFSDTAAASISIPALLLLVAWAAAAVYAWRADHVLVRRLHVVLAAALVLGLVSITRIHGMVWYYLVLWSWGTTMLLVVATVWTGALAWRDRWGDDPAAATRAVRWGTAALAGVLVAAGASFTYDAAHTEMPYSSESRTLAVMAPRIVTALRADDVLGGGEDGRYLVEWRDSWSIGSQGFGLLLELERQGFDVGVPEFYATSAVPHRVMRDATARLVYASGPANIAELDADPDATQLAYVDLRTADQRDRFEELRGEVVDWLHEAGLDQGPVDGPDNLVDDIDRNLFVLGTNDRIPDEIRDKVQAMMDLGLPTAVYVSPVVAAPAPGDQPA